MTDFDTYEHELVAAIKREIDEARAHTNDEPVRIRVTLASMPGTMLLMPEEPDVHILKALRGEPEIPVVRRELRVHPDDWLSMRDNLRQFAEMPDGDVTHVYGIPVIVEEGALPDG